MGLDKVKDEVLGQAAHQAAEIIALGKTEAKLMSQQVKSQMQTRRKLVDEELAGQSEVVIRQAKTAAELKAQKEMLALKKDLMDVIFDKVRDRLGKITNSERKEHITVLMERAASELKIATVYCNERDSKFVDGYTVIEQEMLGGLIAENEDGTVRVDLRYDGMIEQLRAKLAGRLVEKLFT